MAPDQAAALRAEINISDRTGDPQPPRNIEETLIEIYQDATSWFTKKQILSIFVDRFSKTKLQEMIPGLTKWRIDEARKHAALTGRGLEVELPPIQRSRLDLSKVDHFLDFISHPPFFKMLHMVQSI